MSMESVDQDENSLGEGARQLKALPIYIYLRISCSLHIAVSVHRF